MNSLHYAKQDLVKLAVKYPDMIFEIYVEKNPMEMKGAIHLEFDIPDYLNQNSL